MRKTENAVKSARLCNLAWADASRDVFNGAGIIYSKPEEAPRSLNKFAKTQILNMEHAMNDKAQIISLLSDEFDRWESLLASLS